MQSIARLHAEHYQQATKLQRIVERMTALMGRPSFLGLLTVAVLVWVLGNLGASWAGGTRWTRRRSPGLAVWSA